MQQDNFDRFLIDDSISLELTDAELEALLALDDAEAQSGYDGGWSAGVDPDWDDLGF